jgi:hypothetical protein
MRYTFSILFCIFLLKSDVFSQSDTTTVLKDSVRTMVLVPNQNLIPRSIQFMETIGIMPLPYKSLNQALEKSKYQGSGMLEPDWAGGSVSIGLELQQVVGDSSSDASFILAATYSKTGAHRGAAIGFSRITADLGASFRVFKNDWFALYPFFLFSPEYNVLTASSGGRDWDPNPNGNFKDYFDNQVYNTALSSGSFSITPGVGADVKLYTFFKDDPVLQPMKLLLGVRSSYQIGLFSPQWTDGRSTLMNGPDVAVSGFRFSAALGFAIDYKIFKAKIISEEK